MSNQIDDVLESLRPLFEATNEALNEWNGQGNLQFPILIGSIAVKLNWTDKEVRNNDPMIRYFVRTNKDWYVTRGAHGGIMKVSEKQKKEAAVAAKISAKEQIKQAIEAGMKTNTVVIDIAVEPANDNSSEQIEE